MQHEVLQKGHVRHNFAVNFVDGTFFGLGTGLASYVTVMPLFVATLTNSTILIGLIATIHLMGWQLPQLFMAGRITRLGRYRETALLMTLHERVPLLLMGVLALRVPYMSRDLALLLFFVLLLWQSFGSGFTGNVWQSMIGKIFPSSIRGTFYGTQSGGAALMSSAGAFIAGTLLVILPYPVNFSACFLLTAAAWAMSWVFLSKTREMEHQPVTRPLLPWRQTLAAWRQLITADRNFAWFIVARALMQFAQMAMAFYTIYAVRRFGMDAQTAGILTGVMLLVQMISSPLLGYLGDRLGHRWMLVVGCLAMGISALTAILAPALTVFGLAFVCIGVVNTAQWTSILSFTSEFGDEAQRPYYIGLSNTLITPATLLAPLIGGVIADSLGFNTTFVISLVMSLIAAGVIVVCVGKPARIVAKRVVTPSLAGESTL